LYRRIENKRFLNSEYNQGNGNGIGGADLFRDVYPPGGDNNTAALLAKSCFNRFIALSYNSREPQNPQVYFNYNTTTANGRYATQADAHNAYLNSALSLNVPRGNTANNRIGRDINVHSDNWEFRVSIPKVYPGATNWTANGNNTERLFHVRLVGIMQHTLERPGQIGFTPGELFENPLDIHTSFSKDDAQGYSVVYDQIKRVACSTFATVHHNSYPRYAIFKTKLAYLRRYSDGTFNGQETELNAYPTDTTPEGTMKGQVTWYFFIEDEGQAMGTATKAITEDLRTAVQNPTVARIEVIRNTFFTDP
jgi:hypothetical protein